MDYLYETSEKKKTMPISIEWREYIQKNNILFWSRRKTDSTCQLISTRARKSEEFAGTYMCASKLQPSNLTIRHTRKQSSHQSLRSA